MVEYVLPLDNIFASLADPTRRDILERVAGQEMTVGEIAEPYDMSLAAISKHLQILEQAKLIIKRRRGRQKMVTLAPYAFKDANEYLEGYKQLWEERLDALDEYIRSSNEEGDKYGTN